MAEANLVTMPPAGLEVSTSMAKGYLHNDPMADFSQQRRIPELDGLRGIAILLVLAYHYLHLFPKASYSPLVSSGINLIGMGWAGVDLFFVLSGFLIGGILLDARKSPVYFKAYYFRRFFRIVPLYYTWIGLYVVLVLGVFRGWHAPSDGIQERWISVPVNFLFLQNIIRIHHAYMGTAWLSPLWSLAVEEQFYLVIPLAVRFLSRLWLVIFLCATVVCAPILRWMIVLHWPRFHEAPYFLSPCRADALAIGVLLAMAWRHDGAKAALTRYRNLFFVPVLLLALPVVSLALWDPAPYSHSMQTWGYTTIDLGFAFLLAWILVGPRGIPAALSRSAMLQIWGRVSYCVYIIHQAVALLLAAWFSNGTLNLLPWVATAVAILGTAATFGIANISWSYFERPVLRIGHSFQY